MRNFLRNIKLLLLVCTGVWVSCENMDSTEVLKKDMDTLEERIEALEKMHDQVKAIQEILDAGNKDYQITSIENIVDENTAELIGYKVNFLNGTYITLYKDGVDGVPPIAVVEENGILYWQVNGVILEYGGEKVPVSKGDPQFRYENGEWQVSYNNGPWEAVPVFYGNPVIDIHVDVSSKDYVLFTINGKEVKIAWYKPLDIALKIGNQTLDSQDNMVTVNREGEVKEFVIDYEVSGFTSGDEPDIKVYAYNGYTVKNEFSVEAGGATDSQVVRGKIVAKSPELFNLGKLVLLASDGKQRCLMRTIVIMGSDDGTVISMTDEALEVDASGNDNLSFTISSDVKPGNLKVEIPEGVDWISVASDSEVKALSRGNVMDYNVKLVISKNENYYPRSAEISIVDHSEYTVVKPIKVKIVQKENITDIKGVTAGQLQTSLSTMSPEAIAALRITGTLGNTDIEFLKKLSSEGIGKLIWLDISETANTSLTSSAFNGTKLQYIALPKKLTHIWDQAFRNSQLERIEFPSSLATIKGAAFMGCKNLKEVVIHSATKISNKAFRDCTSLKQVKLYLAAPPVLEGVDEKPENAPFGVYDSATGQLTKVPELYTLTDSGESFQGWWENYFENIYPNLY